MTDQSKTPKRGNLLVILGGLFTTLSLTIIEDNNWKIATAAIAVALALYGVILIQQEKKKV